MSGWVKLHRKLLDWEWYSDKNCRLLFIHCLLKANYEDTKWRGIDIQKGSFISSLANLSKSSGLTIRELRTALTKLKSTCEVTSVGHAEYTMFTVVMYNDYQTTDTPRDKQATSKRQASDKQATTVKERKNIRIKEIKNIFSQKVFQTFDEVIKQFPLNLHPKNKDSWLKVIDELIRIDKIPPEIIIEVTKKARQDSFWQSNFLSITKLRKKNPEQIPYIVVFYEKFLKQKTNGNTTTNNKKHGTTEDELAAILADHFDKQRRGVRD